MMPNHWLGIMKNSNIIIAREWLGIIIAREWLGIIPMIANHQLSVMEPKLALPCYNVKIASLTSETGKDASPWATCHPQAFSPWAACGPQGGIFPLIPRSGVQFCPSSTDWEQGNHYSNRHG